MGLFMDAFGLTAGARLGDLAVQEGLTIPGRILDSAARQYQMQYFDPVVRSDLCELMATGFLSEREYPFPVENTSGIRKKHFFIRHKVFAFSLAGLIFSPAFMMASNNYRRYCEYIWFFSGLLILSGIVIYFRRLFRDIKGGSKAMLERVYRPQMDYDGEQYWHVREYIRLALLRKELNRNDAIRKLSSTRLVQQFPDTTGEIEANAFAYQRQSGR